MSMQQAALRRGAIILTICLLAAAGTAVHGQVRGRVTPSGAPPIRLRAATFVPAMGQGPSLPSHLLAAPETGSSSIGRARYLVQFREPIQVSWRDHLEATGARILDYIPDYAYKVEVDDACQGRLREVPGVAWVGPYHPGYCLSPDVASTGRIPLRVELYDTQGCEFMTALVAVGGDLIGREGRTCAVEADASELARLIRAAEVRWIAPLQFPRLLNDVATREISATLAWDVGYAGVGQVINIADTGIDTGTDYPQVTGDIHGDVDNRVAHIRSWPISSFYYGYLSNPVDNDGAADVSSGHGTHVAGSAVGNGHHSAQSYRGVAHQAALTFQAVEQYCDFNTAGEAAGHTDGYHLLGIPSNLTSLYAEAYGWGARVHSNSWGFGDVEQGAYNEQCRQTDRFVWEHRDMVILFATGNESRDADRDGRADYGSILPPATAKNVIAVGAVENRRPALAPPWPYQNYGQFFAGAFPVNPIRDDPMADAGAGGMMAASGRGPTRDGRIAPHVVAPGTWIASMRSSQAPDPGWGGSWIDSHYMYLGGTSMSTPLVAGCLALVRQAYLERGHTPSAALLKATLIQTARDIPGQYAVPYNEAGPIPNNDEGWGAVDVAAAVAPGRYFVDEERSLQTGDEAVYVYTAGASTQPAKFTLVWTDYPAAVEAAAQLVNDLDLTVTAPDGKVYRGNVFSGGWSATGGGADRVNNVECVHLPASQTGTYVVSVRGHNVPQGPQDFALLVSLSPKSPPHRMTLPLTLRDHVFVIPTETVIPALPTPAETTIPPTLAPTVAPGEFRDDFDTITGMWTVTTTESCSMDYLEGEYRIRLYPERDKAISPAARQQPGDLLLEVEGHAANDVLQQYGLLFNYRSEGGGATHHAFVVSTTGYYAIIRHDNSHAVDWTASQAIAPNTGRNRLSLRRVGERIECSINDILVKALDDAEFVGGSGFGLVVFRFGEPHSDARFDNFRMLPL